MVAVGERRGPRDPLNVSTGRDDRWRDHASCRFTDPVLFFPVGSTGGAADHIRAAQAVCVDCRVRSACLQFAVETNQEAGVWGGTSEEERRTLRRAWLAERPVQIRVTA